MQPYYGTVQLGTPAVTNAGGQAGLTYLENFVRSCTECAFNFVNVHFFLDRSTTNVSQYIQELKDYIAITVPAIQAKLEPLAELPIAIGEVRPSSPRYPPILYHQLTNTLAVLAHRRFRGRSGRADERASALARRQRRHPLLPSRRWLGRRRVRQR